jgi:hypothetical protein
MAAAQNAVTSPFCKFDTLLWVLPKTGTTFEALEYKCFAQNENVEEHSKWCLLKWRAALMLTITRVFNPFTLNCYG